MPSAMPGARVNWRTNRSGRVLQCGEPIFDAELGVAGIALRYAPRPEVVDPMIPLPIEDGGGMMLGVTGHWPIATAPHGATVGGTLSVEASGKLTATAPDATGPQVLGVITYLPDDGSCWVRIERRTA